LNGLTAGCGSFFEKIGSDVAQLVNKELVTRQKQFAQTKLRFRNSFGAKRSLGWIPFKAANLRINGDRVTFTGKTFRLFQMDRFRAYRNASGNTLRDGNFAQNALDEWFLNGPAHVLYPIGTVVPVVEDKAKYFHAKAKNQRMNFIHQTSTYLVKNYQIIKIGDVSLSFLRAGNHAKSALDGGWGLLKAQLHTKGRRAGRWVNDVPEKYSTRTCSTCWAMDLSRLRN
jgi:putative transposase